jgi:hypothetical protein
MVNNQYYYFSLLGKMNIINNQAEHIIVTSEQKNELRLKLQHRGGDYNGRIKEKDIKSNGKRIREVEIQKDKKTIKSLACTIAALFCKADDPE